MDGDSYGYEISKNIVERGIGLIDIKDATIYTAFRRMENDGLLATYWGEGRGRRAEEVLFHYRKRKKTV